MTEEIIKAGGTYRIFCTEPTDMMIKFKEEARLYEREFKDWMNTISSYNQQYVHISYISRVCGKNGNGDMPYAAITGCTKIIPLDCFEEYQASLNSTPIEDSVDVDFF